MRLKGQLERLPYPGYFRLANDDLQIMHSAQFYEWTEIKRSSKLIQVPKWIVDALDQYLLDVKEYSCVRDKAFNDLKVSLPSIGYRWGMDSEANDLIVSEIFAGELVHPDLFYPGPDRYSDPAQIAELWPAVLREADKLESVRKVRSFYRESVVEHTDWLIREMAKLIQYIKTVYEIQEDLI